MRWRDRHRPQVRCRCWAGEACRGLGATLVPGHHGRPRTPRRMAGGATRVRRRRHDGRRERHRGPVGRVLPGADRAVSCCRGINGSGQSVRSEGHHECNVNPRRFNRNLSHTASSARHSCCPSRSLAGWDRRSAPRFIACQDFGPQGRDLRPGTLTMMNSLSSASVGLRPEFGKLLSHPIMSRFAAMR